MFTAKQFAIAIVRTLRERGHEAYLCGGCVRDLLLGREPADYDVTTDATPEQVMRIFPQTYAVGRAVRRCARSHSAGSTRERGRFARRRESRIDPWFQRRKIGRGRSRHVPFGRQLQRWSPPRCRTVQQRSPRGCATSRFHDQRLADGSDIRRDPRFRGRTQGSGERKSSGRLANHDTASRKTNYGCFGRSASRHALAIGLIRRH